MVMGQMGRMGTFLGEVHLLSPTLSSIVPLVEREKSTRGVGTQGVARGLAPGALQRQEAGGTHGPTFLNWAIIFRPPGAERFLGGICSRHFSVRVS